MNPLRSRPSRELLQPAWLFLRLGATAFGGPAAHIALMREETVRRRRWLTDEEFLDLIGATQLIPGPNSTEMALHIGWRRAGLPGLLVAGLGFILPSALLVTLLAWSYVRFGQRPRVEALLHGVKPVMIAIVIHALWGLARRALRSPLRGAVAALAAALALAGIHELIVLFGAGALPPLLSRMGRPGGRGYWGFVPVLAAAAPAVPGPAVPFTLGAMFLFFLKVGAILFGSGYVLLAFLRADLVERWHWLTEAQLLDAIAVSQLTPGPVFTAATFIGYLLGGLPGAVVATVGIFFPAFVFVGLTAPLVARLRTWPLLGDFLDGLNAASLALMGVVTWHLGRAALADGFSVAIAGVVAVLLFTTRINPTWYIIGGALTGMGGVVLSPSS